jgi:phosphohistidine swiveling domain-containing protein
MRHQSEPDPAESRDLQICWLSDLAEEDREVLGAKSVNLALMARRGLPVPDGFAIGFCIGHSASLSPEEERAVRAAYAQLALQSGSEPTAVAVRSSAVGEDGAELSFAGQYSTCLDVVGETELIQAVAECLASRSSDRAASYLTATGSQSAAMGVLVQRMVQAEYAGVCFTESPTSRDELVIELVEGLGESLVSGTERPARVCLARDGLELCSVDDPEELLERLAHETLQEVARLSLQAEAGFGFPVDVEWALADGAVSLLQSRPITASLTSDAGEGIRREEIERLRRLAKRAGRVLVWSDFSVADMIPRPSPLAAEVFGLFTDPEGSHVRAMRELGLRPPPPDQLGGFFEVICGRGYLDLNASVQDLDWALPIALDERPLRGQEGRGVDLEQIPVRLAWRGWRSALRLPGALLRWLFVVPLRFFRLRRGLDQRFRQVIEPQVRAEAARLRGKDLTVLDRAELWSAFSSHLERFMELIYYHQLTDAMAFTTHGLLRRILKRLYGDQRDAVEMRLTTGLPGNFNTLANLDLARVAAGQLEMGEFLERYGQRGSPEYEISAPRWREDPERVEAMARAIAGAGVDPLQQFEQQQEIRRRAEAQLSADIGRDWWLRPWRGAILRELDHYQRYSPLRETTQGVAFLFVELARRVVLEVARRAGFGELIFFIGIAELRGLIFDGTDSTLLAEARERRRRLQAARRIYLPHTLRSDDLEAIGRLPELDPDARELFGQGVSPGVVRGQARVAHGLEEARQLEAGEILVTASADPSWTPLFLVAGGMVLEQGGMLSHPAIVAREYGLPAVVNVPHVTRSIQTGQWVTVDGDRGRVVLDETD